MFALFAIVGFGTVDALGRTLTRTRRYLLAPVVGLAVLLIFATALSRIGLPARLFAPPLVIALLALNLAYCIARRRPRLTWKRMLPWSVALLLGFAVVGWPLFVAGTNWIAFGNGDMTTYVLGAVHFLEHGFYQLPKLHELLSDRDPSWDYSFYYSFGEIRSGSQMLLAIVSATMSLHPARVYMMLELAIHLSALCGIAALVCSCRGRVGTALAVFGVVAASANLADGTLNQLMPQALGLTLLLGCLTVMLCPLTSFREGLPRFVLAGILVAGLLTAYPELFPFLIVPLFVYAALSIARGRTTFRRWLALLAVSAAATVVCANVTIVGALHLLLWASTAQTGGSITSLFPYYLKPVGFALGWGLVSFGDAGSGAVAIQLAILVGAVLYVATLIAAIQMVWNLEPVAIVAATMLLLFVPLFALHDGFGLFKLVMYAQPFAFAVLTLVAFPLIAGQGSAPDAPIARVGGA